MKYRCFLFDFDYTLADSSPGIIDCFQTAFQKNGLPLQPEDAIRATIGMPLPDSFRQLTGIADGQTLERLRLAFVEQADKVMAKRTRFFEDTQQALRSLHRTGAKLGIVTTKFHYRIVETLDYLHAEHLVDCIVGGEDVSVLKPDPEGLFLAIEQLNAQPEETLYTGDSLVDAKAAQAAGLPFAAVTTGTTPAEAFRPFPHVGIFSSLTQLYEWAE